MLSEGDGEAARSFSGMRGMEIACMLLRVHYLYCVAGRRPLMLLVEAVSNDSILYLLLCLLLLVLVHLIEVLNSDTEAT